MPRPLLTFLLPGIEGTGLLFQRFVAAATGALDLRVVAYPSDRFLGYHALEERVARELPADRPFAILGESFGGPLALRLAARCPPGLVGVVLVSSFHRLPAPRWIRALKPLAPAFFTLPLPPHAVRLLLGGHDCDREIVAEVRRAVSLVKGWVMAERAREALTVDVTEALRSCPVPLLFLSGAEDRLLRPMLPAEVRAIRPDVELRALPSPHLVLQRYPHDSMRIVEEFLQRAAAARPRADEPASPATGPGRAGTARVG